MRNKSARGAFEMMNQGLRQEKGTFVALLLMTCVALVLTSVVLWIVPYIGFSNIHQRLPLIMAIFLGGVVLYLIGGALTLVVTILLGKNFFVNRRIRGVVIRFLFPLLVIMGKLVGINKKRVQRAFIAVNNDLVMAEARHDPPKKVLLLLPQCIQYHECPVRITSSAENCKGCGKCKMKDLVALSHAYHTDIAVATGGTLARKIVVEKRPDIIIAVACERDLTSGIQDTYPLPVFGILNRRPFGPCFDTDVDIDLVEQGLKSFLGYEKKRSEESCTEDLKRAVT